MDIFTIEEAKFINKSIFETIYHAALERSNELSMERIDDMKVVKNYINFDVNIFQNMYDGTSRKYCNISDEDKAFNGAKPIFRETKIDNPNW